MPFHFAGKGFSPAKSILPQKHATRLIQRGLRPLLAATLGQLCVCPIFPKCVCPIFPQMKDIIKYTDDAGTGINDDMLKDILISIDADSNQYRTSFNRIYSRQLETPGSCIKYFYELLVITSKLYIDCLNLRNCENKFYDTVNVPLATSPTVRKLPRLKFTHGKDARLKFNNKISSLPCWGSFDPSNEFSSNNLLKTHRDYINSLQIHLPDIYDESIRINVCVRNIVAGKGDHSFEELLVRLEHVAHHASYCRHTLELLSHWAQWE